MDAPKCSVCGVNHWLREPHVFGKKTSNGADTNCRTLRTQARMSEGMPGSGGRGMNGQREVSRQGIVRPTNTNADEGKAPKGGKRTPGRSGDSSSLRLSARAGETLAKIKRRKRPV